MFKIITIYSICQHSFNYKYLVTYKHLIHNNIVNLLCIYSSILNTQKNDKYSPEYTNFQPSPFSMCNHLLVDQPVHVAPGSMYATKDVYHIHNGL